jgi:putative choline sulfate-utilization transcription factor
MGPYCFLMSEARNIPPLSWLLAFEAAARHKSFGSAAAALNTSQPAISQRIANLEASLGAMLFSRTPRGVLLTSEGAHLLAGLAQGLAQIEATVDGVRRMGANAPLTIATDFGFAALWLVPRLPSLQRALLENDVRVMTSQSGFDLSREPVDVAVMFGSGEWPGCSVELLVQETVIPVCSPDFLKRHGGPVTPCSLRSLPLIHVGSAEKSDWLDWAGYFHRLGLEFGKPQHHVTINNHSLVIQAALAGQGVALGWRPLVDGLIEQGHLVPALDRAVRTSLGYYVVAKHGRGSQAVRRFRDWLRTEMSLGNDPV